MQKRRSTFTVTLLACLILMVFVAPGYGQQRSSAPQTPEAQTPPKTQKPAERVPRYPAALAGLEVLADLRVTPREHTGPCPTTFTFEGKITVNRPATIYYRFVRSDNTRKSTGVLTFEKAGTQAVKDTWEFNDPAQPDTFTGWAAVQISLPMKVQSNTAFFNGKCTERTRPFPAEARVPQKPSEGRAPGNISIPTDPSTPLPKGAPGSSPPSQVQPAPKNLTPPEAGPKEPAAK